MFNLEIISTLLIGSSYLFLIYNKIAFGITLSIGILLLLFSHWNLFKEKFYFKIKKIDKSFLLIFFLLVLSFSISSIFSIRIERSLPVFFYLTLFMFFSFSIYIVLNEKQRLLKIILKSISINIFIISLLILIYNLSHYNYIELIKFKGYMNIITLQTFIIFFLYKSKINYLSLSFLLPNIFMTGSSSSILGIIFGVIFCLVFFISKKFNLMRFKKIIYIFITITIIPAGYLFVDSLPKKFDLTSVENFEYKIPANLIDVHRQFIWGFSISKFKDKPIFGYGPDTSNYIEDGQKIIGLQRTGDMNFIPSHPHNFVVELLLETGIFGTSLFLILIFVINSKIWNLNKTMKFRLYLIFFNSYFWASSLVNLSFWLGWWQASYFLLLSLIASKAVIDKTEKKIII